MRKLISLVLILALPTMAFAATDIAAQSGGLASLEFVVGSPPATIPLELVVTTDLAGPGAAGVWASGGGLMGPAGLTATLGSYRTGWAVIGTPWPAGSAMDGVKDWGAMDGDGNFANAVSGGSATVATFTVGGVDALPVGDYMIAVSDSVDGGAISGTGYWFTGDGSMPMAFDASNALTIKIVPIPEPATMLLLAGALPFLRRRSA